jgi:hypothetical protein
MTPESIDVLLGFAGLAMTGVAGLLLWLLCWRRLDRATPPARRVRVDVDVERVGVDRFRAHAQVHDPVTGAAGNVDGLVLTTDADVARRVIERRARALAARQLG